MSSCEGETTTTRFIRTNISKIEKINRKSDSIAFYNKKAQMAEIKKMSNKEKVIQKAKLDKYLAKKILDRKPFYNVITILFVCALFFWAIFRK